MGCGASRLTGDSFDDIDATARHSRKNPFPTDPDMAGHHSIDDKPAPETSGVENTQNFVLAKPTKARQDKHIYTDEVERSTTQHNISPQQEVTVAAPIQSTDVDRKVGKNGKKPGLYQRFQNAKLGVGEERDPITGRGLVTGMTKEEVRDHVHKTRQAGIYGNGDVFGKPRFDNSIDASQAQYGAMPANVGYMG